MATISKFYLLDAATPNTGIMPTDAFYAKVGAGSDATGAGTARDATDVAGSSNPDIDATGTAEGSQVVQRYRLRLFVSRPLAARTFATGDGNWTFSYARGESNTNHNGQIRCHIYGWRPSTGAVVGSPSTDRVLLSGSVMAATAETANSVTAAWGTDLSILNGDILVFSVFDEFTQSMSSAYTSFFSYNGTTEANTTTCASFVTPPAALTLATSGTTYTETGYGKESG